jgi:peroxin-12
MASVQYSSIISDNYLHQHQLSDNNSIKPTIFDILAQENLLDLFHSSFNHVFRWLGNYNEKISRLETYNNEIYLILHSTIEYLYLKTKNSLFSEYFYGLKRSKTLNFKLKILSIISSIVLPYLKSKLDNIYETIERDSDLNVENNDKKKKFIKKLKNIFLKFYPFFHLIWSLLFWCYRFMFIFNFTDYNSPLLHLLGIRLVYNTENEVNSNNSLLFEKISYFTNRLFTGILFFIQFFNWYENISDDENLINDEQFNKNDLNINYLNELQNKTGSSTDMKLIEPPKMSEHILKKLNLNNNKNDFNLICPLCNSIRTNDCALSTSGFVFCYPCIFKFINKNRCCPITKTPSNLNNLVRIYKNS